MDQTTKLKELQINEVKMTFSTAKYAGAKETLTDLTLLIGDLTVEDLVEWASRGFKIYIQGKFRSKAFDVIPTTHMEKIGPAGTREASTGKNYAKALKLILRGNEEMAERLIAKHGNAKAACEAVEAMMREMDF